MTITLYHHPFSRAAGAVWMLEEVSVDYELRFCDILKGEQKQRELTALNPMGKIPTLVDGEAVVTEAAAIGLYLADRYAPGRLAPALDDPRRAAYLRWSLFPSAVIEPGSMAKIAGWGFKPSQAGWGEHAAMLTTMEKAIGQGPFLLGETFTMADVIFGGTLRYMLTTGMLEPRPIFARYAKHLAERPALARADAKNAAVMKEHGLTMPTPGAADGKNGGSDKHA